MMSIVTAGVASALPFLGQFPYKIFGTSGLTNAGILIGTYAAGDVLRSTCAYFEETKVWQKYMNRVVKRAHYRLRLGSMEMPQERQADLTDGTYSSLSEKLATFSRGLGGGTARISNNTAWTIGTVGYLAVMSPLDLPFMLLVGALQFLAIAKLGDRFNRSVDEQNDAQVEFDNVRTARESRAAIQTAEQWGIQKEVAKTLDDQYRPVRNANMPRWGVQSVMSLIAVCGAGLAGALTFLSGSLTHDGIAITAAAAGQIRATLNGWATLRNDRMEVDAAIKDVLKLAEDTGYEAPVRVKALQPRSISRDFLDRIFRAAPDDPDISDQIERYHAKVKAERALWTGAEIITGSKLDICLIGATPRHGSRYPLRAEFPMGTVAAIVGPSGVGKTTAFAMISGKQVPLEGTVEFRTDKASWTPLSQIKRDEVSKNVLTISRDTVLILPEMFKRVDGDILRRKLEALELNESQIKRVFAGDVKNMSDGQTQRIKIAFGLARVETPGSGIKALFLDEPHSGLNPRLADIIAEAIKETAEATGITVLIITHDMERASQIPLVYELSETGFRLIQDKTHDGQARATLVKSDTPEPSVQGRTVIQISLNDAARALGRIIPESPSP